MEGVERSEIEFLKGEILDGAVYSRLSESEPDTEVRGLMKRLSVMERGHALVWTRFLADRGIGAVGPAFLGLRMKEMLLVRRILGIAFMVKLLERHEKEGVEKYRSVLESSSLTAEEKKRMRLIIGDELGHEKALTGMVDKYRGNLDYIQSIVFGLNDGLVEILAIVAGIATVATTSLIVVILGLIAGISGTLSMAGGAYLSAKSENLVGDKSGAQAASPVKEAYYVGMWYFIGALLSVAPFIIGLTGAAGLASSILLVCAALVAISFVIAVMSGTSVRRRVAEMLAISLGAAFVTIMFSTFAKIYFGVSI